MNDAIARDRDRRIREVLAWYMRAMRLRDVDLMDDVFTADAIIDYTAIGGSVASWPDTKPWLRGMIDVELFMLFVGDVYPVFAADRADRRGREHVARRVRRLGRRSAADRLRDLRRPVRPHAGRLADLRAHRSSGGAGPRRERTGVTYRVLHCGTGNAGALALRGVIAHPDLELVGRARVQPRQGRTRCRGVERR